mgnify:CR=1 FL=1
MIKCVCILGNGVVDKGKIYYLKKKINSFYEIYDIDLIYLRDVRVSTGNIPRAFMRIEEHREKIIDSLINN